MHNKSSKLDNFSSTSVISSKSDCISKVFHGVINGEDAIVLLNKTPFEDDFPKEFTDNVLQTNDIYTSGVLEVKDIVKYTVIHPASECIIQKYTTGEYVMVKETYEKYKRDILPLALSEGPSHFWIETMLGESQERLAPFTTTTNEEILYIDPEFVICPDQKWDRVSVDSLYLLVIFKDPSVYTIRELTYAHLPLLKRIRLACESVLGQYSHRSDQVKMYFHYYPTFFRAHIHVSSLKTAWLGTGIGSSVLLHDVIENISMCPAYYQEKTLEIAISKNSYLYKAYLE